MLNAALGYTTEVMAVMLDAALGLLSRRRRLAWVKWPPHAAGLPGPVLGALGETGSAPPSVAGFRDRGGLPLPALQHVTRVSPDDPLQFFGRQAPDRSVAASLPQPPR
jgi:hypothetical protein